MLAAKQKRKWRACLLLEAGEFVREHLFYLENASLDYSGIQSLVNGDVNATSPRQVHYVPAVLNLQSYVPNGQIAGSLYCYARSVIHQNATFSFNSHLQLVEPGQVDVSPLSSGKSSCKLSAFLLTGQTNLTRWGV